jgi:heptosyltransferase-2
VERILIIQTAFIGDAILTLPMIQKLKELYPSREIHVLSIQSTLDIFSSSPFVDKVLVIDKKGKQKSFFSFFNFVRKIKSNNYSLVYSPHRSFRSALIAYLIKADSSYCFSNSSLKFVYKNIVAYIPSHHEVRRNLDLIGFKSDDENWKILPQLIVPLYSKEKINSFFAKFNTNNNFVTVAPGSVWNTKNYPIEYYEKIVEYFVEKQFHVIIIGGAKDKVLCDGLAEKFSSNVYSVAGEFSILETVELLKRVKILISNDSAPTHLAMCADIPVLTIYCSTVQDFGFFPYNNKSKFISYDALDCKPCGIHGHKECPLKTFDCGWKLKPEFVISKIEEILSDQY